MTLTIFFWVVMVVWLIYIIATSWPPKGTNGIYVIIWVLLALLGWAVFGGLIHK